MKHLDTYYVLAIRSNRSFGRAKERKLFGSKRRVVFDVVLRPMSIFSIHFVLQIEWPWSSDARDEASFKAKLFRPFHLICPDRETKNMREGRNYSTLIQCLCQEFKDWQRLEVEVEK